MNDQRLNVDISVLRRGYNKLLEEKTVLRDQINQLSEAICELESCWDAQSSLSLKNETLSLFAKLNSLVDGMDTLSECMNFALKIYLGCENAAEDSISAIKF